MTRNRILLACVVAFVLGVSFSSRTCWAQLFDKPAGSVEQEVDRLTAVLKSDAPAYDKGQACKRLAFLGDARCVPVLAAMLGDERLSHSARYALESIPDPAADEALRNALDKVKGKQLVGVINSIGVRGDRAAVKQLGSLSKVPDDEVASAAAAALGQIATPEAAQMLATAMSKADGPRRRIAWHDASLRCAERLAERNQTKDARGIYERLVADGLPRQVRIAAALGILRTEPEATASKRFEEYLASPDNVKFEAAIYASSERKDRGITRALAASMNKANEAKQVQLLDALRVRGDAGVVPQIAGAFEKGSPQVKIAALTSLGQIGDRQSVPLLIKAATDNDAQVAATAIDGLVRIKGQQIDETLLQQLPKSSGAGQRVVIVALGRRSVAAAAPALLALLQSADEATRIAALEALGQTVGEKEFASLLDQIPAAKNDAERNAAVAAVDAACRRMPSADAVAMLADERMKSWPEEHRPALVKVLGAVGGKAALVIVVDAAVDGSPELQDAGTRQLGQWMTPDAAPHLYKIASNDSKYKTRALRGYLRIARQLNLPDDERLEMCRKALAIAERAEERELALDVMKRCPSAESVELASSLLDDAEIRDRAVETAIFIGEKIKDTDPEAAKSAGEKALEAAPQGELADRARALTSP